MSILDKLDQAQRAAVDKYAAALQPELGELIAGIEAKPKTTQDHYGQYMSALSALGVDQKDKAHAMLTMLAMIVAGGNENGIRAAYKIIT